MIFMSFQKTLKKKKMMKLHAQREFPIDFSFFLR